MVPDRRSVLDESFSRSPNFVVLYGSAGASAAVDLESRFTEAALGATQISDLRNFAHGRHHWLAKHGESTSVIGLFAKTDQELATRTLENLPKGIPVLRLNTRHRGLVASLALSAKVLYLAEKIGQVRGIDPGRPGVPPFGSRIYHLNAFRKSDTNPETLEHVAIRRKSGKGIQDLRGLGQLRFWERAYRTFIRRLREASFAAVIFDYDGTICGDNERFTGVGKNLVVHLRKLLEAGLYVGIATGRGRSVRDDLRSKLPKKHWGRIVVGYYNGSEIASIDEESVPDRNADPDVEVAYLAKRILQDKGLAGRIDLDLRPKQVTVIPTLKRDSDEIWQIVQSIVETSENTKCRMLRSSHSFDIIPKTVSKTLLVEALEKELGSVMILCIGDRGVFPGNDFELLKERYSLSVDEVSVDPGSCWNIASPGNRGTQAAEEYLGQLVYSTKRVGF